MIYPELSTQRDISTLGLSSRTKRILRLCQIMTVDDLEMYHDADLLGVRGFGKACLSEVRQHVQYRDPKDPKNHEYYRESNRHLDEIGNEAVDTMSESVKTTPVCDHDFMFVRSEEYSKWLTKVNSSTGERLHTSEPCREDVFYCRRCLECRRIVVKP